jgi:hypothetical protein
MKSGTLSSNEEFLRNWPALRVKQVSRKKLEGY